MGLWRENPNGSESMESPLPLAIKTQENCGERREERDCVCVCARRWKCVCERRGRKRVQWTRQ